MKYLSPQERKRNKFLQPSQRSPYFSIERSSRGTISKMSGSQNMSKMTEPDSPCRSLKTLEVLFKHRPKINLLTKYRQNNQELFTSKLSNFMAKIIKEEETIHDRLFQSAKRENHQGLFSMKKIGGEVNKDPF